MTNPLSSSQQLQLDKQNYGTDYIHLYVDNIKSNWLENWTWDDSFDSNDWATAFLHNVSKSNFKVAFNLVTEWLKQV